MASACIPCSRTTPISWRKISVGSAFRPLMRSQPGPASAPSPSSGSGAAFCIRFLLHWRRAAVTCPGKSSCRGRPSSCRFPMTFWRSRWTIWPWREGSGSAGKAMRSRSIPTRHGGRSSRSHACSRRSKRNRSAWAAAIRKRCSGSWRERKTWNWILCRGKLSLWRRNTRS